MIAAFGEQNSMSIVILSALQSLTCGNCDPSSVKALDKPVRFFEKPLLECMSSVIVAVHAVSVGFVCDKPKPSLSRDHLRSGRKQATLAAVIPMPASIKVQYPEVKPDVSAAGPVPALLMNTMRMIDATPPTVPNTRTAAATNLVREGMLAIQRAWMEIREKTMSVATFMADQVSDNTAYAAHALHSFAPGKKPRVNPQENMEKKKYAKPTTVEKMTTE
ncbi:hypothetical protein C1H76_6517 [Elsinoe australis]|uniref:Uncharacterized protein n=1 Tax=Elsinoe australis TaxID=40998 RepID=A0A4U7ASZ1_9PEZI|nr:hypothetical protein C1H76_6517 [Elsinoe australis]